MNIKNTLFSLCSASSASGDEIFTAPLAMKLLSEFMPAHIDAMGNVVGENDGEGEDILLDAHLDTIGMVVTGIEDDGFLHVDKCGGVDLRTLPAHDVAIHGKKTVYGVVTSTPPHLSKDPKEASGFDMLMVDTGLTSGKAKEIISLGDRVTFATAYRELLEGNLSGAYFDDKAGVVAILRCLEILKENNCKEKVSVLFSAQEETGSSGAIAAGFNSDATECICVDVSFAKSKGTPESVTASLGGGTMIGIAPALNYGMANSLKSIAAQEKIPFQLEIMGGKTGTNSDYIAVSKGGKRTALLSIPLKNMHTPVEVVNVNDIESTAQLMARYIMNKGGVRA
ncbi:MAG: M20/M25/M40 family metallo-hydrolase [Clostridia bacterium]|nr:M20/M25/M40 family metallo-hydrolase [Clostridia bacterium]